MEHFSLSLLGYQRQQVNLKFDEIQQKVAQLEKEIERLQGENQRLNDELGHFRSMEEALQKGILDARVTGNKIIDDSTVEAERLMRQTKEQVIQYKEDFAFHSRELAQTGNHVRAELTEMKKKMQGIMDQYQQVLDETDFDAIYPKKQIERLLIQVDAYEHDQEYQLDLDLQEEAACKAQAISDQEKVELEQLIQEVITNEALETHAEKLVDFSIIRNTQEG